MSTIESRVNGRLAFKAKSAPETGSKSFSPASDDDSADREFAKRRDLLVQIGRKHASQGLVKSMPNGSLRITNLAALERLTDGHLRNENLEAADDIFESRKVIVEPPRVYTRSTTEAVSLSQFDSATRFDVAFIMSDASLFVALAVAFGIVALCYVGHSNGTYLLAKALQDYPAVKFKNVAFAGSVVNKDFDWSELIQQRRVEHVLNFRASADWVVAWFPNALQEMGLQDLGSAGHDGFKRTPDVNTRYVVGGHGAALDEDWWDAIAQFVITGTYTEPKDARAVDKSIWWVRYPAYVAWAIWVLIAVASALLLRRILRLDIREWQKTLAVVGYFYVIWTILTQV